MTCDVIFLCGFMGAGKTTYSNILKSNDIDHHWHFVDLDCWVAQENSLRPENLGEAIEKNGWAWFREQEKKGIERLLQQAASDAKSNLVCSLGGGALNQQVLSIIKLHPNSWLVWLDLPFETLYARIKDDANRPMVKQKSKQELEKLFQERATLYSQADLKLDLQAVKKIQSPDLLLKKLRGASVQ